MDGDCSVVVAGLAIERYVSLRRSRVLPTAVEATVALVVGEQSAAAADELANAASPGMRVLAAGVRRRGFALADVEKAMEDTLAQESARMRGNVRGIVLMASVSPLLGLLGTVLGIADAFAAVEQTGLGKAESSEALAAGIKVALYTTIFGLFVAIPATLVAAHLQARARRLAAAIASAVSPAIEALARRPADPQNPQKDTHAA